MFKLKKHNVLPTEAIRKHQELRKRLGLRASLTEKVEK